MPAYAVEVGVDLGASGRVRTDDISFTRRVLYQLSYGGVRCLESNNWVLLSKHLVCPARFELAVS